jgi:ABC-type transporter Mla MlaB component
LRSLAFMKTLKRKRGTAAADAAADTAVAAAAVLVVASSCTVKDAAEFKIGLCKLVDSPQCVVLDAGNIERIDTAALQLLCAFVRDRRARGLQVLWRASSAALLDAATLLGMKSLLGLHETTADGAAP